MKQEEAILQSECFKWAWNTYPDTRRMLFHIPNGGYRNIQEGAKFKAMGVISGVADMCFLHEGSAHFFEFKARNGNISPDQVLWHDLVRKNGFDVYITKDFNKFKEIFEQIIYTNSRKK